MTTEPRKASTLSFEEREEAAKQKVKAAALRREKAPETPSASDSHKSESKSAPSTPVRLFNKAKFVDGRYEVSRPYGTLFKQFEHVHVHTSISWEQLPKNTVVYIEAVHDGFAQPWHNARLVSKSKHLIVTLYYAKDENGYTAKADEPLFRIYFFKREDGFNFMKAPLTGDGGYVLQVPHDTEFKQFVHTQVSTGITWEKFPANAVLYVEPVNPGFCTPWCNTNLVSAEQELVVGMYYAQDYEGAAVRTGGAVARAYFFMKQNALKIDIEDFEN